MSKMKFKKMKPLDPTAEAIMVYIRKFEQRRGTIRVMEQPGADIVDSLYKAVVELDTGEEVSYIVWVKEAAIVDHWIDSDDDHFNKMSNDALRKIYEENEARIKLGTSYWSDRTNMLYYSQCMRDEMKRRGLKHLKPYLTPYDGGKK